MPDANGHFKGMTVPSNAPWPYDPVPPATPTEVDDPEEYDDEE